MKQYILDANAVIRYLQGGKGADKVEWILLQCAAQQAHARMSVINAGEVYYGMIRLAGEADAISAFHELRNIISFVPVELEQAIAAAKIKAQFKLGYADSFAAALAIRENCVLVTADPDFDKLGKSLKLLKLPRHAEG